MDISEVFVVGGEEQSRAHQKAMPTAECAESRSLRWFIKQLALHRIRVNPA